MNAPKPNRSAENAFGRSGKIYQRRSRTASLEIRSMRGAIILTTHKFAAP